MKKQCFELKPGAPSLLPQILKQVRNPSLQIRSSLSPYCHRRHCAVRRITFPPVEDYMENLDWGIEAVAADLFVCSTTNIVGNDLAIVGGGAACYAFRTKFSEPAKIKLLHVTNSI
ncbi:hypothetical protein PIB30_052172 [Stylosanthes scabra]|uniref:Uncharacterized protein n=1 Tax=Stylosanthes scabra TaxID=79078 RepID=A0ABU6RI94_9FABA|nr:hypothetical protein [Stylosanthes scabra]